MTERRVPGAGLELSLREWGDPSDPTVVLVHGYPDTAEVWRLVAEALVDHGYRAVAYDVRGAGASDAPDRLDGYDLDLLVADLRAVVDAVSPGRPVHLVGHDWGSIQGWEAVCSPVLEGRVLGYTSISGPPLDHVGQWLRRSLHERRVLTLARQAVRSSYIGAFHLPGFARGAGALQHTIGRRRAAWSRTLARTDGARVDQDWPAVTFGTDLAQGMGLYRANVRPRFERPAERRAHVPVQLIVPVEDRFVPAWLLEGLESVAPDLRRRTVTAGHWVPRSHPVDVASWIAAFADELQGITPTDRG